MEEIVKRITQILEEQQLSSSAFADTIGVQRSSISHVLSGRNKPSLEFILKTVRAFPSYSTDWLLFGRSSESPVNYPEAIEQDSPSTVQDIAFTTNPMTRESSTDSRLTSNSQAEIDKIVLLYKDGRFTEYIPKND
ncbi:MAG: transcriptional regulator [Flavobacteriaceae bacterium]|nr:transcriptional regulator [Flavobacteriaceae bacterium]|tara:strand:+ start:1348 stop:1755 length:408 start_codon:yes stop_codon:yes gene_type:complete